MGGRLGSTGLTRTAIVVGLVIFAGMGWILLPALQEVRFHETWRACGHNLSAIGKAMVMYANDHDALLPLAGGKGTRWGPGLRGWSAVDRSDAFGLDPNGAGGEATISSSLYLLIRYMEVSPKSFLCKGDKGVREFKPSKYGVRDKPLTGMWDFGTSPAKHCSYAYQMVYAPYKLTSSGEPGLAIAADRNPWMNEKKVTDFWQFEPDLPPLRGSLEQARYGNAVAHEGIGQNVLFLDTHVVFEMRPYCGYEDDNIYTSWDGADKVRGKPPKLGSQPAGEKDSLLVNDPPVPRR